MQKLARLARSQAARSQAARSQPTHSHAGTSRAVRLRRLALATAAAAIVSATIATPATAADTYTQTRYPIVLVHGIFGFDTFQGAPYFYGIEDSLKADSGGATLAVRCFRAQAWSKNCTH